MKHTYTLSFLAISALALAGCSTTAEPASEPEPTAVTDLGTAIPPSASASSTANGGESGGPASTRTAPGHSRPVASAQGGSGAQSAGASGVLTAEEQAKVDAGEYVAATDKHPAYNVPVPVMPEAAKQQTDEGAKAFVEYWVQTQNYTIQTGNATYEKQAINPETYTEQEKLIQYYQDTYSKGGWVAKCLVQSKVDTDTGIEKDFSDATIVTIIPHDDKCRVFDSSGKLVEEEDEITYNNQKSLVNLDWKNNAWIVREPSGIPGVDYGK